MDFLPILEAPGSILPILEEREDLGPFVYFIRHGDRIKIGTSINPARRLSQLSRPTSKTLKEFAVGDPELVACIPGSAHDERQWHHRFSDRRTVGEWFLLNDELREAVAEASAIQLGIELQLAGADTGSPLEKAIFFRRFSELERLLDEEYAWMYDSGELDDMQVA